MSERKIEVPVYKREYSWWRVMVVASIYIPFTLVGVLVANALVTPLTFPALVAGFVAGYVFFYILRRVPQYILLKHHIRGLKLMKANAWEDAAHAFNDSIAYFQKNRWVDDYRALTLFNSSKMSFLETDMNNIAACQLYMANVNAAEAAYRAVLDEFPENPLAQAALHNIETIKKARDDA